ncbi:MAG TPA: 5'-3' exonuclease H3TH domain-containing protein, partial [Myxococcota bacterium]|nr:5'-3' exonuclease H3TH domain-containing protein [Myxococcota bacterium]
GVPGIGPKSAAKLLETFGDLDGLYAGLGALSPRERSRLEASRELAFLSRSLTRLVADAPLPCPLEGFAHRLPPI